MVTNYRNILQNIVTVTKHCYRTSQNIDKTPTHPTTQLIKDCETQITTDTYEDAIGKTENVSFSSGSESRDSIRRVDLLRKRVPRRRRGARSMQNSFDHRILYGQMDDRVVRT